MAAFFCIKFAGGIRVEKPSNYWPVLIVNIADHKPDFPRENHIIQATPLCCFTIPRNERTAHKFA